MTTPPFTLSAFVHGLWILKAVPYVARRILMMMNTLPLTKKVPYLCICYVRPEDSEYWIYSYYKSLITNTILGLSSKKIWGDSFSLVWFILRSFLQKLKKWTLLVHYATIPMNPISAPLNHTAFPTNIWAKGQIMDKGGGFEGIERGQHWNCFQNEPNLNCLRALQIRFKLGSFLILRNEPNLNLTGPFR